MTISIQVFEDKIQRLICSFISFLVEQVKYVIKIHPNIRWKYIPPPLYGIIICYENTDPLKKYEGNKIHLGFYTF